MDKIYYLDNAATTKVFEEEFDLMKDNNESSFYNPSASYKHGNASKKLLNESRKIINESIHGTNGKFVFTSSATESNNAVFRCVHLRAGQVVLVSAGEHPAVYNSAHELSKKGVIVKDIPLTSFGVVDVQKFKEMITSDVALISIIHVSNETGAVNDIKELCAIAKQINNNIIFHSDGVQALGRIKINLRDLGVDLYTVSAHKVYAPRGIAGLWIKDKTSIDPILYGGGQEDGLRSSTENVAGSLAFAYSVKKLSEELDANYSKVLKYKDEFIERIFASELAEYVRLNSTDECIPYIISLSVPGIKGEVLVNALEDDGVIISTGSACSSKKAGNRILEAMGKTLDETVGSLRISFSPYIDYDIKFVVDAILKNISRFIKNAKVKG